MPMKLVILDRDGTINEDSADYIKSAQEWQPLPGDDEQWLAGGLVHPIQQPCPLWQCSQ